MINPKIKIMIFLISGVLLLAIAVSAFLYFTHGTVKVDANLSGAEIFINNESKGNAPLTIRLKNGHYKIETKSNEPFINNAIQEVDVRWSKTQNITLMVGMKNLSLEEVNKLTQQQKDRYQALSDQLTTRSEDIQLENNPLTQYLPYIDPDIRFRIDYNGNVVNSIYYLTVYGLSDQEAESNIDTAKGWISNIGVDPDSIKIEITKEIGSFDEP